MLKKISKNLRYNAINPVEKGIEDTQEGMMQWPGPVKQYRITIDYGCELENITELMGKIMKRMINATEI